MGNAIQTIYMVVYYDFWQTSLIESSNIYQAKKVLLFVMALGCYNSQQQNTNVCSEKATSLCAYESRQTGIAA